MRTVADIPSQELEQLLGNEIASARSEARPISRLTLTRLLQSKYSLPPHDAERIVDRYCDEKAPGVPTYLSSEFGTPYLKVLAVVNVVIGLVLGLITARSMSHGGYMFLAWLAGTLLFIGSAALFWVKSVAPEKRPTRVTGLANQLQDIPSSVDAGDKVATRL